MYQNKRNLLLTCLLALCSMIHTSAYGAIIPVGTSETYTTIQAGYAAANNGDTLELVDPSYSGAGNNTITFAKNLTLITKDNAQVTIELNNANNFCTINLNFTVTMSNLLIQNGINSAITNNGTLTTMSCTFSGNSLTFQGGAINNGGILDSSSCTFNGNSSSTLGGAILNNGTLNLSDCTFKDNTTGNGGAILNYGTSTLSDCTFSKNHADGGGAILNTSSGTFNLSGCTFSENAAGQGGAISDSGGTLTISDCTFRDNSASSGNGGAILSSGTLTPSNCTFSGNSANGAGGAISNSGSKFLNSLNCTFSKNIASNNGGAISNDASGAFSLQLCTLNENTANNNGGAIYNQSASSCIIHCCSILGNIATIGSAIYNSGPEINAQENWWGSNTDPKDIPNLLFGDIDASHWITISLQADPVVVLTGGTSIITVRINSSCNITPMVTFSATNGTMSPASVQVVDGVAQSTLSVHCELLPVTVQATIGSGAEAFSLNLDLAVFNTKQELNKFPLYSSLANVITWLPIPPSIFPDIASYWIYRAPDMMYPVAIIHADKPLIYVDHNKAPCTEYTYYIYAINSKGEQSVPAVIKVP